MRGRGENADEEHQRTLCESGVGVRPEGSTKCLSRWSVEAEGSLGCTGLADMAQLHSTIREKEMRMAL